MSNDKNLTDLSALTTPITGDLFYVVTDPGGTPLPRKITIDNAFNNFLSTVGLGTVSVRALQRFKYGAALEAPFTLATTFGTFESTNDPVMVWGYNAGGSGTRIVAGVGAVYHSLEGRYRVAGEDFVEWNFETITDGGTVVRPLAYTGSRITAGGSMGWHFRIGDSGSNNFFRLTDWDSANFFFQVDGAGLMTVYQDNTHLIGEGAGGAEGSSLLTLNSLNIPQFSIKDGANGNTVSLRVDNGTFASITPLNVSAASMPLKVNGRIIVNTPDSAPTDANLSNGQSSIYVDQSGNKIKFRVKYSDGTLKTAEVALT